MSWFSRFGNVFRSSSLNRALDEEIEFHIQSRIDDLIATGMTRETARAVAFRQFGNRLRTREYSRDIKLLPWLESLIKDGAFAVRILRRHIVVTVAAVASLGLAVGGCLAAFSLVDALILRPLPVRDPYRLIQLTFPTYSAGSPIGTSFSYPLFSRLRDAARGDVELFATSQEFRRRASFGRADQEDEVRIRFVSGNAFSVLGVRAAAGRLLVPSDDVTPGAHPVAVISHGLWRRRFGSDPSIVGSAFTIGDKRFEIVGVAQEGFTGIEPGRLVDLWLPVTMYDIGGFTFTNLEWNWLSVLGRLKAGVSPEDARSVLQGPFSAFRRELTSSRPTPQSAAAVERYLHTPLALPSAANGPSGLRRQFERPLWVLTILVGLVLVIAASNVANLFLARADAREREMSLRLSIGATRSRLVQQVLVEGVLVTTVASVIGLVLARIAAPTIVDMLAPPQFPIYLDLRVDWRFVVFLCTTGALTTILFALAPALRASSVRPIGALQGPNPHVTGRAALLRPLVAIQVGFSAAVLLVATLLLSSFGRLVRVDPGFSTDRVLLVNIDTRGLRDPEMVRTTGLRLLQRIRSIPGVNNASLSAWPLFSGGGMISRIQLPGQRPDAVSPPHLPVSPGFFATMGIPILEGRDFETRDSEPEQPTQVIVSRAFVRRFFGGGVAIGRVYERVGQPPPVRQEVVGVVADIRQDDLRNAPPPMVYVPFRGLGTLEVRGDADLAALQGSIDHEVRATNASLRVVGFLPQSALVSYTLSRERLLALLSGFFAAVGLLLAAVGLYGVLHYSVVRRTREIGIRTALGAQPASLVGTIVSDAALMTGIGIVAGLTVGFYLSRLISTFLYEVRPTDASSAAVPIGCLLLAAVLAAVPAARRIVRLDPVASLRVE